MVETHRCSLDMKECQNYDQLLVKQMCRKFEDKNAFWSPFMTNIQPKLTCPIKKVRLLTKILGHSLKTASLLGNLRNKQCYVGFRHHIKISDRRLQMDSLYSVHIEPEKQEGHQILHCIGNNY
jgi:hypothetical protein